MKVVVQRVKRAKVTRNADNLVVGEIASGLFVLVGFKKGDSFEKVATIASKLAKLRIMSDKSDKMNLSLNDVKGSILIVSQFTLYADTSGGNRPSFVQAEEPVRARELYNFFIKSAELNGLDVKTGSFGDYMIIDLEIDGPVTIVYEL